jgi:Fe-S-cluster containining protein
VLKPFYERQPLRFECTRCGRCCVAGGGYYVFLNEQEAEGIRARLGLSRSWFRRRYLNRLPDGDLVASWHDDGRCVFLDARGECSIYPVRPVQCRTYPFWSEIVTRQQDWQRESRRCEGIDRGREVPVIRILKLLGRDLDSLE